MLKPTPMRQNLTICLCFIALLLACYWLSAPALSGPFLFDDFPNLERLATVAGTFEPRRIGDYLAQFPGTPGRPLSTLSFLINDNDWPTVAGSFKHTNLMLHLLIGVILFGLARTLAKASKLAGNADWIALLTMAAWLLHPMQLSTSMLVVQRMTQLSALFAIAGLWAYTHLASSAQRPLHGFFAIAALGIASVLAVLSKETGALTPLLACVINATLLKDVIAEKPLQVRRWLWLGCTLPVLALGAALALQGSELTNYASRDFSLTERLMTQSRVLLDYLRIILLPNMRGGLYHDDFVVSRGLLEPATTLGAIAVIAGLVALAVALRRSAPLFTFAIAWFFAGHLLESTVFPLEIYFEHRNYLPMFGILFALSATIAGAAKARAMFAGALSLWIGMCAFMLHQQAIIWGNEALIATLWAKEKPHSQRAIQQYSLYLQKNGRSVEAIEQLLAASQRGVGTAVFPFQALQVACAIRAKGMDTAKLLVDVQHAAGHGRFDFGTTLSLGKLRQFARDGQCPALITNEGWLDLTDRLLVNPAYARSSGEYQVRLERGYFYRDQRNLNHTITEFEAAYAISPRMELSRLIAMTLWTAGLNDEAITWLEKGLARKQPVTKRLLSSEVEESKKMLAILRSEPEPTKNPKTTNQ